MATLTIPELLRRVPFFEHLSETQTISLIGVLEKQRFKRSETLVVAGQKTNKLFVILSGTVNVTVSRSGGRELILATLGAGEWLGEMSLVDNEPHSATVVATSQVDVLMLTREGFNSCILHNAPMAMAMMQGLVQRLRKCNNKTVSLTLFTVFGRVASYLLELAEDEMSGQKIVKKKLSHAAIAREVGASREMVSRALKEFEAQSFIVKMDNGHLLITDRRAECRQ